MERMNFTYEKAPADNEEVYINSHGPCTRFMHFLVNYKKQIIFLLIPIVLLPLIIIFKTLEYRAIYVVSLMAMYWLTEALPLAVTALIPVLLFPLFGIASSYELSQIYMKEIMMLTLASLFMGVAMEAHNVHRRIAIKILLVIGTGPKRLLLGFLCTGCLLSMVTTNCATATMMVPVVKAVLQELSSSKMEGRNTHSFKDTVLAKFVEIPANYQEPCKSKDSEYENSRPMYLGCLLAVAYGTSIGGTGTLTGAAPNLILKAFMDEKFPEYSLLTFSTWTVYNLPGMVLAIMAAWIVLYFTYVRKSQNSGSADERVRSFLLDKYSELGPIKAAEKILGILFLLLMLLWFFRSPGFATGWGDLFCYGSMIGNATPAVFVALLLFVIPCGCDDEGSVVILKWKTAQERTPWGVLLLLGGGLALSHGAKTSGLMDLVAEKLLTLSSLSSLLMLFSICLLTLVTTEFLSNTSTASLFIPVISQLAVSLGLHPLFLLLPVTICCSYAFMLPMATSPNAIVFQNSRMKTSDMALPGVFLNVLCCAIQVGLIYLLGNVIFALNVSVTTEEWIVSATSVYNTSAI